MENLTLDPKYIRNVAIIAHVDHGKTTLVDAFFKQSHMFRDSQAEMNAEQILDTGDLEREKGITIKAKNASIRYKDFKINIIDTPGHADFGGEVERTLNMAEGCILVVDAQEGPMPQTKFVLKKAFDLGLTPIVVINKIDKPFANPIKIEDQINDLFLELAKDESQLEFPVFYAVARDGKIFSKLPDVTKLDSISGTVTPILDKIIEYVPQPINKMDEPFRMQITNIDRDPHLGRYLIGKIDRGIAQVGNKVNIINSKSEQLTSGTIKGINIREGLDFVEVDKALNGEIVAITGIDSSSIGATITDTSVNDPLPNIEISPPALSIKFEPNTSPFLGQEGKFVNFKQLQQRLERESENNISLDITKADGGYYVAGRGELQLSILIETMRREGYEFQIRKPVVILKEENGKKLQPREELIIDAPEEYQSGITKFLMERKAEISDVKNENGNIRVTSLILTTKLFGLRNELVTYTKNQAILNNSIIDYVPYKQEAEMFRNGVLISMTQGKSAGYSLNTIQTRGELFIGGSESVYEGMIIGINKYEEDMEVNPTKERQKTGVRMKHDEITQTALKPIKKLTLEFALVFLAKDEILEVTPKNLRLRKEFLSKNERNKSKRK